MIDGERGQSMGLTVRVTGDQTRQAHTGPVNRKMAGQEEAGLSEREKR